jgi:hypothetical protein
MFNRLCLGVLLSACLAGTFTGCGSSNLANGLAVTPATVPLTGVGSTAQLTATGQYGSSGHYSYQPVTDQVTWSSGSSSVATVNSSGLVTAVAAGTTQIIASLAGYGGTLTASTTVTVTASTTGGGGGTGGGTTSSEPLISIEIIPTAISIADLQGTGQFLAYGTFSTAPYIQDITDGIPARTGFPATPVTWITGAPDVFPITNTGAGDETAGLVTAYGSGLDDVYATAANPDGTLVISSTATFNCPFVAYTPAVPPVAASGSNPGSPGSPAILGSCNPYTIANSLTSTLTVYNRGLNTTGWLVTAPSATGTADVIRCGPGSATAGLGDSVCVASYPNGTTVTLTAPAETGVNFGGWSANCANIGTVTAAGPNTCTVQVGVEGITSNVSVGAIFN